MADERTHGDPILATLEAETIAFSGFRGGEGGLSHVMLNLINAIAAVGHSVNLLLNATNIPTLTGLHPQVRVVELGHFAGVGRILALSRYLRHEPPFALLCNREPANRIATLARLISGTRVPVVFRVGMPISVALARRHALKRLLRLATMRLCYRRADRIIANARDVATDIETALKIGREKITVLNNPTASQDLIDQARDTPAHPWFTDGGPPVVIGVGRLARQKDFPTLIRAFARLRRERPCRLAIFGEGKDRAALEQLVAQLDVEGEVALPGWVANPFACMARSSLFVLSSAWEGSPNVLIQALALGCPVVSTDCPGGSREILADGRYGPIVPVGDVDALAQAMAAVLDAPLARDTLTAGAEPFQAERCAREYLAVLRDARGMGG
jgi:glycosyltransferase involved in cell wall biosynthesis